MTARTAPARRRTYGRLTHEPAGETFRSRPGWRIDAAPHVLMRLRRVFARVQSTRGGAILVVDTTETARDLAWVLERWPLEMDRATATLLRARARAYDEAIASVDVILAGAAATRPSGELLEPAREPRPYQLVAADLALATGRLLVTDEVGLGKSMTGLLVLRDKTALPALIVTLTHLPKQWQGEVEKTFPGLRTHIVTKGTPYDVTSRRRGGDGQPPDVLIMSYSKLRGWADHLAPLVNTVIFDEAQELRRNGSERYTAAAQVADGARFRVGLTATPVWGYGGEIHNVISVLAPDALGSREEFAREWGLGEGDKLMVRDPAALGEYLRDQGLMIGRTRRELARELPPAVRVTHTVDVDEDTLDRLSDDAADLARTIIDRAAAPKDLWRISGDLDWRMRHATGVAKAPYVAEFVRLLLETEHQVVVFAWHRDVIAELDRRLAVFNPVFYTGEESPAQKLQSEAMFKGGASRVLVMSLRSGAGLDGLQDHARVCVFAELDWSPGVHDQCIGRLRRDGADDNPDPVVAYFLVADDGADPVIAEVLNLKRQQAEPLLDPTAALFETNPDNTDRVRTLAHAVLARRRGPRRKAS